jgi:hypothetical protein
MPDLKRLRTDAQEARIFSEMARSRLLAAKASAHERRIQWASAHARRLKAINSAASISAPDLSKTPPAASQATARGGRPPAS